MKLSRTLIPGPLTSAYRGWVGVAFHGEPGRDVAPSKPSGRSQRAVRRGILRLVTGIPPVTEDPPPRSEEESVVLDQALARGRVKRGGMKRADAALLGVSNAAGRFAASQVLEGSDSLESELLNRRAKSALLNYAAIASVRLVDELNRKKPNKVRVDGLLAICRGTGILVETAPVSPKARQAEIEADRTAASQSNEELIARQKERLRKLREDHPKGGKAPA